VRAHDDLVDSCGGDRRMERPLVQPVLGEELADRVKVAGDQRRGHRPGDGLHCLERAAYTLIAVAIRVEHCANRRAGDT
jgi:hypothetical protein